MPCQHDIALPLTEHRYKIHCPSTLALASPLGLRCCTEMGYALGPGGLLATVIMLGRQVQDPDSSMATDPNNGCQHDGIHAM